MYRDGRDKLLQGVKELILRMFETVLCAIVPHTNGQEL